MNAFSLPAIPSWENLHPLMIHFPIVLLTVAGVPLLLSLFWSKQRTTLLFVAATMFLVGTFSTFLAVSTGEAAEHAAQMSRDAHTLAHEHEDMAELTRNIFIIVTLLSVAIAIGAWKCGAGKKGKLVVAGGVLAVLGWGAGSLALANTGHLGATLVHEYGVHANLDNAISSKAAATYTPDAAGEQSDDNH